MTCTATELARGLTLSWPTKSAASKRVSFSIESTMALSFGSEEEAEAEAGGGGGVEDEASAAAVAKERLEIFHA